MILRSIASRLSLWVLAGSTLVLVVAGLLLFQRVREQILRHAEGEASALAQDAGNRIGQRLARVADTTRILAAVIGPRPREAQDMLSSAISRNADLAGLAAVFVPAAGGAQDAPNSPFVRREDNGSLSVRDMRKDPSPYWDKPWFQDGLACVDGCWQQPFYSQSRHRRLINYSVAIMQGGHAIGLVNADVTLDWLGSVLQSLNKPVGAYAFLLDGDGRYLAHDNPSLVDQPGVPALLQALARHQAASLRLEDDQYPQPVRIYAVPIDGTHWQFGLAIPEDMIYADVRHAFLDGLVLGLLALLALTVLTLVIVRRTMNPLATLTARAEEVARGALSFELPPARRPDEIGRLTQAFDRMRTELAEHLAELTRTTREQQRLSSELEIAHQIQTALLPGEHYQDARCENFELHALLRPARAVGGDLYGYFMLGDRRFCVMVGDVSDKGIPAALFMARTITLAKALASRARSPQQLLALLNRELCRHNDSCMFVTLLCGMLDTHTGELLLASAGHEPPVLCAPTAAPRLLELDTGTALGLDEDAVYPAHVLRLQPDETLLMYTDGITEAGDLAQRMYGQQRMLACLAQPAPHGTAELAGRLLADVDDFAAGAGQTDDITVLALHWHHASHDMEGPMLDLTATATMNDVFEALDRCEASLRENGVLPTVREDVRLVLEELLVNMVQHGRTATAGGTIDLRMQLTDGAILIELHHDGQPFDPLQAPPPALTGDLADQEDIGGFGIHLVRAMANDLSYSHDEHGNHLQLRFLHPTRTEPEHDVQP